MITINNFKWYANETKSKIFRDRLAELVKREYPSMDAETFEHKVFKSIEKDVRVYRICGLERSSSHLSTINIQHLEKEAMLDIFELCVNEYADLDKTVVYRIVSRYLS